jgi:predicted NUDIX family phosphoesterase
VKNLSNKEKDYERVLVTPNNQGIHYATGDYFHLQIGGSRGWEDEVMKKATFVERWLAEEDSSVLQLIPYVMLISQEKKIFSYARKGGGEKGLEGKRSVGVGGHINTLDKVLDNEENVSWETVQKAAAREVSEEVYIDKDYVEKNLKQIGTIYTPSDNGNKMRLTGPKVGEVHLGIVYTLKVADVVNIKEDCLIKPKYIVSPRNVNVYERWSQVILSRLSEIKPTL